MIQRASRNDIPELVRSIWLSEHTGNELYSYQSLYGLDEEGFQKKFADILNTDSTGHSLCYSDFWLYKVNNKVAGVFSLFLEGSSGDSSHIMTGLLMEHFDRPQIMAAFQKLAAYKSIQILKTKNTYQLDSVSVLPEFRGQGIFGKMLKEVFETVSPNETPKVEIQVWIGNSSALKAYEKEGFHIKETKRMEGTQQGRILLSNF